MFYSLICITYMTPHFLLHAILETALTHLHRKNFRCKPKKKISERKDLQHVKINKIIRKKKRFNVTCLMDEYNNYYTNREQSRSRSYGRLIYKYLCNQWLSTLKLLSSIPAHGEVYSIQLSVIKFVSDWLK